MDANLIICIIMIVICVSLSIFGWRIIDKWDKKVNAWKDNHKHREEYMECLIMGWVGWMLALLGAIPIPFLIFGIVCIIL